MYFGASMSNYQPPPRAGHCEFLEIDEEELDTKDLQTKLVSSSTTQRLLQVPAQSAAGIDALALISDLNRLAPTVAKDFIPKPLAQENLSFKLINDVDFEGEEESYIALSYVWNKINRDTPKKMVSPDGDLPFGWVKTVEQFPLPTSRGMFLGFLNERREEEGIFFDQVCINQDDEMEKAITIGAMDTIYRNARTVVVALDDIAVTEEELLFLQQYVRQYAFSELPLNQHPNYRLNPPFMQQQPLIRSFLERLLSSIWFERAWCAHEMRMARSLVFLAPSVPNDDDEERYTLIRLTGVFFVHMLVLATELTALTPSLQTQIRSLLGHFEKIHKERQQQALVARSSHQKFASVPVSVSLIPTIAEVFQMKAGGNSRLPEYLRRLDANRDKTSITLNICNFPLVLKPASPLQRPALEDECLRQLLLVGLAAQDPIALCTTGSPLKLHDGSISWLCRPTALDLPSTYSRPPPQFPKIEETIVQASDGRAEYVQIDLVFLDLPHRIQPSPTFTAHVQRARELVSLCIQCHVQSHSLWNLWQAPNHPREPAMRNIFAQTLACAFECGPQWLLDISSQLTTTNTSLVLDPTVVDALFNPQLPLQTYIHHPAAIPSLSNFLHTISLLVAHGMPWASGGNERTHGPLIVTTPMTPPTPLSNPFPSSASQPSPFSPPQHHHSPPKSLIFAPYEHSKTLLVAIPDAVKGEAYKDLARGWVLTPSNPYTGSPTPRSGMVSWELRGKGVLFGERRFVEGVGSGAAGMRRHRVYGPGAN